MVLLYVPSTIVKSLFDTNGNNMSLIDRHINDLRLGYNAQKINTVSSVLAFRDALSNYKSLSNGSSYQFSKLPRYAKDSAVQVNQMDISKQMPDQFSKTQNSPVQASHMSDQFSQTQDSPVQASHMSDQFSQTQDGEHFNFIELKDSAQQKVLSSMATPDRGNMPISLFRLPTNASFNKVSNKPVNIFNDPLGKIARESIDSHHSDRHLFLQESVTPAMTVGGSIEVNDGLLDLMDLSGDRDFIPKQKEEFANIIKTNVDMFVAKTFKAEGLLSEFNNALLYYASKDKIMYSKFDNDSFNVSKVFFDLSKHKEALSRIFILQSQIIKEFNAFVDKDDSGINAKKDYYIKLFDDGIKSIYRDFYFDIYVKSEDFEKEYNKIFDHYIYDYIDYQKKIKLESFHNLHNILFDIVKNSEEIFIEKSELKTDVFKKILKDLKKKTFNVSSELQQKINHLFSEYDDSLNKLKIKNVYSDYVNNANKLSEIREKIETQYNGYLDDAIKKYQDIFDEFDSKIVFQKGLKGSLLNAFNKKLKQEMHVKNDSEHRVNSIGNIDTLSVGDKINDPLIYKKEDILINFHHKVNNKIDMVKLFKNATHSKIQKIESLLEHFKNDDKDFFDSVFVNDFGIVIKFIEKYKELNSFYDEIELMAASLDNNVRLMAEKVSVDDLSNKCNASFDDFASTVDYKIGEYYEFFDSTHNDINPLLYSYVNRSAKHLMQKQDEYLEALVKGNIDLINKLRAELIDNMGNDYGIEEKKKFVNSTIKHVEDLYLDGYKNIIKYRNQLIDNIDRQGKDDPVVYYELYRNSLKNTITECDKLAVDAQRMMDSEMRSFVKNAYFYDSHKTFKLNSLINDCNFVFYDLNDNIQKYRNYDYLGDSVDFKKSDALMYLEEKINNFFDKESLASKHHEDHKKSVEGFLNNYAVNPLIKILESNKKYFDLYGHPYNSLGLAGIDLEVQSMLQEKLYGESNFIKLFNQILKYFNLDKSDDLLADDQKKFFSLKAIKEFIADFESELIKGFSGNTEKVSKKISSKIQSEDARLKSFNINLNAFIDKIELLHEELVIPKDSIDNLRSVGKEFNDLVHLVKSKQDDFFLEFMPNFFGLLKVNTENVDHLNSLISKKFHHINESMSSIKNNFIQLSYDNYDSKDRFVNLKDNFTEIINEFNKSIYSCSMVGSAIGQYSLMQNAIHTAGVDKYATNSFFERESVLTPDDYNFDSRQLKTYDSYDALAQKNPNDFNTVHNAIHEDTQKHYKDYIVDHESLDKEVEKKDFDYKGNVFDAPSSLAREKSISKHYGYNDLRANFDDGSWHNKNLLSSSSVSDVIQEMPYKNQTTEGMYLEKQGELDRYASIHGSSDSVGLQEDSIKGGNYSDDSNKDLFGSDKYIDSSEKFINLSDYKKIKRSGNKIIKKEIYDISDDKKIKPLIDLGSSSGDAKTIKKEIYDTSDNHKLFAKEFNSYDTNGRSTPKNLSDRKNFDSFEMLELSSDVVKKDTEIDRGNLSYEDSSFLNDDIKKSTTDVNNDLLDDVSSDYVDKINVNHGYKDKVSKKTNTIKGSDSLKSFDSDNDKLSNDNKLISDKNFMKKKQDKFLQHEQKKINDHNTKDYDESFVSYDVSKKENIDSGTFYTKMLNIIDFLKNVKHDNVVDQKYKEMTMGGEILMSFMDHNTLKDPKLSADYANKAFISFKSFFSNIEASFGFDIFYIQSDELVGNVNKFIKEYIGDSLLSEDVVYGIKKINEDIDVQNKKVLEKLNSLHDKINDMQSSDKSFVKIYDIMDDTLYLLKYIKDYNIKIKKNLDSLSTLMAGDNPSEMVNLRLKLYKYLYKINILTLCHIENYAQDFSDFDENFLIKVKGSDIFNIKANSFNIDKFIKDVSTLNNKMLENIENKSHKEINEFSDIIRKKTFVFFNDVMKIAANNGSNIVSHGHKDLLNFIEELSKKLKLSESDKLIKAANIIGDDELSNYNNLLTLIRNKKEFLLNEKDNILKQYYKLFDLYLNDLKDIYTKKDLFVDVNESLQCFFDFVDDCDKKYSEFQKSSETFFDELYDLVKLHKDSSVELKKNTSNDIEGFVEKRKIQHNLIYSKNLNKDLKKSTKSKLIDAARFVVSRAKKPFMRKKSEKFTDRFNSNKIHVDRHIKKGKESDTESNIGL